MAIHDNVPLTHTIRMNGSTLLSGDECSVKVIFSNLTGRNFEQREPWQSGSHADYMTMMQVEFNVTFDGSSIELAESGKPAFATHHFQ